MTRQGHRDQQLLHAQRKVDPRGEDYYWLAFKGTLSNPPAGVDIRAIYEGRISVSPLHMDLTHDATLERLKSTLSETIPRS